MLVWLLVLLLLVSVIYVFYRLSYIDEKKEPKKHVNHYTFKI